MPYFYSFLAFLTVVSLTWTAVVFGRRRFDSMVLSELPQFLASPGGNVGVIDVAQATRGLPLPVKTYLQLSLGDSCANVRTLSIRQEGSFRLKPEQNWMDLTAEERLRLDRPAYHWRAKIKMAALLWFDVRDFYLNGEASILGKLESLLTIVQSDRREVALGALIRWASEAPWFPQVFLNRQIFQWISDGPTSAKLIVRDRDFHATLHCTFGENGLLTSMSTDDRPFEEKGRYVKRTYLATFHDWLQVGDLIVPMSGEATWLLPSGPFTYVKIKNSNMIYA